MIWSCLWMEVNHILPSLLNCVIALTFIGETELHYNVVIRLLCYTGEAWLSEGLMGVS